MTDLQDNILAKLQSNFDTLWNLFCQYIPEAKELISRKDKIKFGMRYAKRYKSLCDTQQDRIKSPCLFDGFVSSFGNDHNKIDFQREIKHIAKTVKVAINNAILLHSDSIIDGVKDIIKQMIITIDLDPSANNPDYRNRLNELLVFNWICDCKNLTIHQIAYPLGNGKDCDFRCLHSDGTELLIEVVSIQNIDLSKQDNAETFSEFINKKVVDKYKTKTEGISHNINLRILPILDYVDGIDAYCPSLDDNISLPAFTVIKNTVSNNSKILLTPIEELRMTK